MIDRALCSSSMAQLAQWLMLLLLRLLLLPGIAPALTFMAVGVDFLWPAQRKKKTKIHFSFCISCVSFSVRFHRFVCIRCFALASRHLPLLFPLPLPLPLSPAPARTLGKYLWKACEMQRSCLRFNAALKAICICRSD